MPRHARRLSRSGIYHIILRGINRQTIFEDEEDKERFLETVKKYKEVCHYELYSYCLMDNHIHLLIKESEEPISNAIKRISSSYVYWYNLKYERCGHLFQERFKSENVESDAYFITVLRYIHQNPLKAGLATNVFESRWTSINEYVGRVNIIDIDFGLQLLSPDREKAIEIFKNYMKENNNDQCLDIRLKTKMSDQEVREYLYRMGITNMSLLQRLEREDRDCVLYDLKMLDGVTVRQLSRITGISKSVIDRIR